VAAAALVAASASPAGAAVQVGRTLAPTGSCGSGFTRLQTSSGGLYTVPTPGVFTAWSFQAAAAPPMLQLKVARPAGGTNFTIVGESDTETMSANALRSFSLRIPVQAGDVIGSYQAGSGQCSVITTGFTFRFLVGNQMTGTTPNFTGSGGADTELPLSATLEPDADHDGFGDETQDQCPTSAGTQGPCPVTPATPVKKKCKKHKKKHHSAAVAKKKCKKKHH
jgi:hypothetical protein